MSTRANKKHNNQHLLFWTTSSFSRGVRTTCQHTPMRTSSKPCSTSSSKLQQQQVGTPVNKNNLADKQRRSIIDTRWAISGRPSSSSSSKTTLKARFCGKDFTQEVSNAKVETYAATPSSQSLRLLLEYSILHNWQVTSCDVSSAFLTTPITTELYVVPPREFIQDANIILRLNKALYGLRTAPQLWQQHLGSTLAKLHLEQLKSDRCV